MRKSLLTVLFVKSQKTLRIEQCWFDLSPGHQHVFDDSGLRHCPLLRGFSSDAWAPTYLIYCMGFDGSPAIFPLKASASALSMIQSKTMLSTKDTAVLPRGYRPKATVFPAVESSMPILCNTAVWTRLLHHYQGYLRGDGRSYYSYRNPHNSLILLPPLDVTSGRDRLQLVVL